MKHTIDDLEHEINEALLANIDIVESRLLKLKEIIGFKIPPDMPNKKYRMLGWDENYEIGDEVLDDGNWKMLTRVGEDNHVFMGSFQYRRRI